MGVVLLGNGDYLKRRFSPLHASRTHSTSDDPAIMITQSSSFKLHTLKNYCMPGNSTMAICPMKMITMISNSPLHPLKCSALRPVS